MSSTNTCSIDAMGQLCRLGYLAAAFLAAHSLTWQFGHDQALFATVASAIADGGIPYRDAWEMKGPLTHYVYALAIWAWRKPEISIRILDLLVVLAFSAALHRFASQRGGDRRTADYTVIFFLFMYYGLGYWDTAQPDGWAGMIILGVAMLLTSERHPFMMMTFAGFLVAVSTLLKPTFGAFILLPILTTLASSASRRDAYLWTAACVVSFCVSMALAILFLSLRRGGMEALVDAMLYNMWYAKIHNPVNWLYEHAKSRFLFPLLLLATVGLWLLLGSENKTAKRTILIWVAISVALIFIQHKYFPYHLLPFLIAISLPSGMAMRRLELAMPINRAWLRSGVLASIFMICLIPLGAYALRNDSRSYNLAQDLLSAYLHLHSNENDMFLIWGDLTSAYSSTGRKSPTRFPNSLPLAAQSPLREKYRNQFMQELTHAPPRYIIVATRWPFWPQTGLEMLREFPEFNHFLNAHYEHVDDVDVFQIWETKAQPN